MPPLSGHCICGSTSYALLAPPLITHCCHCTHCQQSTGSAFALNAMIESYKFSITSATSPVLSSRPSPSGAPHWVASCPNEGCGTVLYALYGGNRAVFFVRVGTLDGAREVKPDVHIFAGRRVGWVDLGGEVERGVPVFEEFYDREGVWGKESLERFEVLRKWRVERGV